MLRKKKIFAVYLPLAVVIAVTGVVAGIALMDWVVMPLVVGKHRGNAIVPSIVSMTPSEARQFIDDARLKMQKTGEEYSDVIEDGRISSQRPEAGKEVKLGRTVHYVISTGSEIVALPQLRERTLRHARLTLKSLGLKTGRIRYVFDDSIALERVIGSSPDSGTSLVRETVVDLTVSQGPEPTESRVPNLIGLSLEHCRKAVRKEGLVFGRVTRKKQKQVIPNTVISQSLSPGSRAPRGATLDLVVSTR